MRRCEGILTNFCGRTFLADTIMIVTGDVASLVAKSREPFGFMGISTVAVTPLTEC